MGSKLVMATPAPKGMAASDVRIRGLLKCLRMRGFVKSESSTHLRTADFDVFVCHNRGLIGLEI